MAANVIASSRERLRSEKRYLLEDLLLGMLEYAPHARGKRYVAVALYIAHGKGADTVFNLAQAWLEHLFLPSQSFT